MGSIINMWQLSRKNGEILPKAAIKELKAFQFEVVLHGEAPEEVYNASINRFNKAWIREAVKTASTKRK